MLDVVTEAAKGAGGVVNLAREMGVNHQTFYSWDRVPAERVLVIERFSKISRHAIRPDIYGPEPSAASIPSAVDSPSRAGEPSTCPNSEISESPQPVHGLVDHVVTPSPVGG